MHYFPKCVNIQFFSIFLLFLEFITNFIEIYPSWQFSFKLFFSWQVKPVSPSLGLNYMFKYWILISESVHQIVELRFIRLENQNKTEAHFIKKHGNYRHFGTFLYCMLNKVAQQNFFPLLSPSCLCWFSAFGSMYLNVPGRNIWTLLATTVLLATRIFTF